MRKESKQKIESLNVLVNQIFRFYIDSHKPSLLAGNIYFPKAVISKILDVLSDEQIEEVAEDYVKRGVKGLMQMSRRKYESLDYLNGLCSWLNVSGFPYKYEKTDSGIIMRMRFDMGKKWCIFFGRVHEILFRDFRVENSTVEIIDNTVTFTIYP
ncbi:hypothetical protein BH18THE2_BH18THE2_32790 [soil metagenome]